MTLTQAPDDWQALRQRVRTLTMRLRRDGYRTEWAWTVEHGSKSGMVHVHALQHGSYVPQRALEALWGRRVDIRAIKGSQRVVNYAMKEAQRVAGYSLKGTHQDLLTHLERNGGRACHYSRGYLRGERLRDVEAKLWPGQEGLTWIVVSNGTYDHEVPALTRHAVGRAPTDER